MYGVNWQYRSAVAYVLGCDDATGAQLLAGIQEWAQTKFAGERNVAWWGQLVDSRFPDLNRLLEWDAQLKEDEQLLLTADLFAALDEFLADRAATFNISPRPS
jgi:hypothetical protein